uniref:ARAD1D44660p n=1 Tax=Blastobotrys adeninivorans TaxID=409370 RepID=A0A060TJ66_BLAAD
MEDETIDIWSSVPLEHTPSNSSVATSSYLSFDDYGFPVQQSTSSPSMTPVLSQMPSFESLNSAFSDASVLYQRYGDYPIDDAPLTQFGAPLEFSQPVVMPSPPSSANSIVDIEGGYMDYCYDYDAKSPMFNPGHSIVPISTPNVPASYGTSMPPMAAPTMVHRRLSPESSPDLTSTPQLDHSMPYNPHPAGGAGELVQGAPAPVPAATTTPPPTAAIPTSCTKWVKLSPMTAQRIEKIKQLAGAKGIDLDTVESVLTLYSDPRKRVDNEVNRFCGDDVYIKITMGAGSTASSPSDESPSSSLLHRRSSEDLGRKKKHRKNKPNYVKRPLNSFMLYRKSQTQSAMAYAIASQLKLNHQNISQIIGLMWQTESKELKDEFAKFAGQEKEIHKALHPDYKFCPQKKQRKVSAPVHA